MQKKVLSLVLVLVLTLSLCMPTLATSRAATFSPSLQFSGTMANCSVNIMDTGSYIDATMELWHGNTLVDSWHGSGTSYVSLSGSHAAIRGYTYTLKVTGTIGGYAFSTTPVYGTCPSN